MIISGWRGFGGSCDSCRSLLSQYSPDLHELNTRGTFWNATCTPGRWFRRSLWQPSSVSVIKQIKCASPYISPVYLTCNYKIIKPKSSKELRIYPGQFWHKRKVVRSFISSIHCSKWVILAGWLGNKFSFILLTKSTGNQSQWISAKWRDIMDIFEERKICLQCGWAAGWVG